MSDSPHESSRERLLQAGKALMAAAGYEGAATAAIARRAGTSESQLMRYFGGKAGLLEAVFDDGWEQINAQVDETISGAPDTRVALTDILAFFIAALDRDPSLAQLYLFEGRRLRGRGGEMTVSHGYLEFVDRIQELIHRGQKEGVLSPIFNPRVLVGALLGAAEAMVRYRLIESRHGHDSDYIADQVRRVFEAMIRGLA
ncbi:MAG TPA: TetR/AcrR family transcriptional regulator [Gammaproteobacteria bacterium]|nr:TetR/AcrR family transcriptional regulator [Gammaproteobacteria bacterium]